MLKTRNFHEIKVMQRHSDCDVNALLLCTFQYLLYHKDILVLEDDFEKQFFNKCFYCGCVNEQAGIKISYFLIPKISFAVFIYYIKKYFYNDPKYKNKRYLHQLLLYAFSALQNGLHKEEKVIIYDGKNTKFVSQRRYNDELEKFLKPLISLSDRCIAKLYNRPDNFNCMHKILKVKLPQDKELKYLYTLYDDAELTNVVNNVDIKYCKRTYRRSVYLCSAKEYLQEIINVNKNQLPLGNKLIKKLSFFLGL